MSKPKQKNYDSRCYDLAEHFLGDVFPFNNADYEQHCHELAAYIQACIEDWINFQIVRKDSKDD